MDPTAAPLSLELRQAQPHPLKWAPSNVEVVPMQSSLDAAVAANLTEAQAVCAGAVLARFAEVAKMTPAAMSRRIVSDFDVRYYFAEVCARVADSADGRKVYAEFLAQKVTK